MTPEFRGMPEFQNKCRIRNSREKFNPCDRNFLILDFPA
jgi:hypothetical protein